MNPNIPVFCVIMPGWTFFATSITINSNQIFFVDVHGNTVNHPSNRLNLVSDADIHLPEIINGVMKLFASSPGGCPVIDLRPLIKK